MKTPSTNVPLRKGRGLLPSLLALLLFTMGASTAGLAQSMLAESFDGTTFPPTGWTRTTSSPIWSRVTAGSYPSQSPHSGAGEADFNSFSVSSGSADLATPVLNFSTSALVQVSFWMYRDPGYSGYTNEKVDVFVNTSATSTGGTLLGSVIRWNGGSTTLAPAVSGTGWYQYVVSVPSSFNGSTNYIVFKGTSQYGNDMYIDDVNVYNLGPCTGMPSTAVLSPTGTQTVCPGTVTTINASNTQIAGNINFQWWQSTNGGTTWVRVVGGTGANTPNYTTAPITTNIRYSLHTICTNTGDSSVSAATIYNVSSTPVYAALPFSESFENWTSRCGTSDIPTTSWTNIPFTGNNSWRRDDEGVVTSTAGWTSPLSGVYNPSFKVGAHSARFHAYYATPGIGAAGQLSMYIDCSAASGAKELQFYMKSDPGPSYPQDSVLVDTSADGGATFGVKARYGPGSGGWDYKTVTFASNSATTVIRFRAFQNYPYNGYPDIYLDGVKVLPPCAGKPTAGTINPVTPCAGQNFTLGLTGTTASAGLLYTWQFLPAGSTGPWTNLAGGGIAAPTANISVPTYFRAIVACGNGGPADVDTSAPYLANLASFYYCYCGTSWTYPQYPYVCIGNVTVKTQPANVVLLNNGNPLPILMNPNIPVNGYTDYRYTVAAPHLIQDSTYRVSAISVDCYTTYAYGGYLSTWIDYNRDGIFGTSELVQNNLAVNNTSTGLVGSNVTIPHVTGIGLTGMRLSLGMYSTTNPVPCGAQGYYGEVEDYLVYLDYPPCTGPVNAGTAWISDTAVCPGYSIDLGDTSYEKQRTNISRMWQYTNNGGVIWFNIAGSANKDTVNNVVVTGASSYRLRAVCGRTGDTTYSNVLNVTIPDPVRCYPYSQAIGGAANDSTDIGAFVIGSFVNPPAASPAGPHLYNPLAVRRRTDYTLMPGIELFADSTYKLSIFQTMPRGVHSDALVSVFMDFNNDLQYNVGTAVPPFTNELVFQGRTRFDSFYLDTKIKMPSAVIPNVLTGMRVIITNDLSANPSNPANSGVGGFVSGEVEDYVVIFRRAALGVGTPGVLQNLSLYPNPTEGKFTVLCDAGKNVAHLDVVVSTITGQQVESKSFDNVGTKFTTTLDLSTQAKGIYFVEVRADGEKITRKLIIR